MPGVEVLPNLTALKAPGWALVPDTGRGLPQVASQVTTKRGRAARASNIGGGDTTVRQQNAVIKHLADLDRDSHRDVQIPVPKDTAGRGSKKTTTNVRRILMSQKTFANHLADEEAALAQQQHAGSIAAPRVPSLKSAGSIPNLKRASTSEASFGPSGSSGLSKEGTVTSPVKDPLENEPLLMVNVPSAPSKEEMQALLAGPPLPYNAARSDPPPPHKPQRHFYLVPSPATIAKHAYQHHAKAPMSLWMSGPAISLSDLQVSSVLQNIPFPSNSATFIFFWTFFVTSVMILLLAIRSTYFGPRAGHHALPLASQFRLQRFGTANWDDEEKGLMLLKDGYVTITI